MSRLVNLGTANIKSIVFALEVPQSIRPAEPPAPGRRPQRISTYSNSGEIDLCQPGFASGSDAVGQCIVGRPALPTTTTRPVRAIMGLTACAEIKIGRAGASVATKRLRRRRARFREHTSRMTRTTNDRNKRHHNAQTKYLCRTDRSCSRHSQQIRHLG